MTKEKLVDELQTRVRQRVRRDRLQLLAIHPGQRRGRPVRRQGRQLGQDLRPRSRQAREARRLRSCTRWRKVEGVADLGIFRVLGQPNLNIKVDREKAARYGLNAGDVNNVVQAALGGTVGDDAARGRPRNSTSRCGSRPNIAATSTPSATSRSAIRRRAASTPIFRSASSPTSRSIPARPISITSATSASSRSSSACAAAISAARSRRRRSGSPRTSSCRPATASIWAGEFEELQQAKARLRDRRADQPAA